VAVHLSEEEQLEALKNWWKEHGTKTIAAIAVAGLAYFGWSQYQDHIENKAQTGSALYDQLSQVAEQAQNEAANGESLSPQATQEIDALAKKLTEQHGDSLYADFANLYLAKEAVDVKDYDKAKTLLKQISESAENDSVKHLARLRLARVEVAAGNYDAALKLASDASTAGFADAFGELKGDVYMLQKKYDEARTAYQTALNSITDPRSMRRSLVQLKLENATGATADVASSNESAADESKPAAEGV
jgi:predicted negative regulator of RcsB-dependent stress response